MRRLLLLTALLAATLSASAQDEIAFRVQLTDARTALLANPNFHELKISDEQLQRAEKDRVLLLDQTSGTKWTWLMLSWPEGAKPEHGLNASGTAAPGNGADISIKPIDAKTFELRCLREKCELSVSRKTTSLAKDQTKVVELDNNVSVTF